jgi:hypothetical protein
MGAASSLYIALHVPDRTLAAASAQSQSPSWALMASPARQQKWESKSATGTLYHASNDYLETVRLSPSTPEPYILLRVLVAKITRPEGPRGVKSVLESVSISRSPAGGGGPGKLWVKEALQALDSSGCLAAKGKVTGWPYVEQECLRYLGKKRAVGRWKHVADAGDGDQEGGEGEWKKSWTPCWDLMEQREVVA